MKKKIVLAGGFRSNLAEGRGLEPLRAFARLFSRQVPYHSAQPSFFISYHQTVSVPILTESRFSC